MLKKTCTKLKNHYTSVHGLSDTASNQNGVEIMLNLTVASAEAQTDTGFFIITTECGNSLACCLVRDDKASEELSELVYFNKIDADDSGFDEGLCGDTNEWALDDTYGNSDEILAFIIETAKECEVNII